MAAKINATQVEMLLSTIQQYSGLSQAAFQKIRKSKEKLVNRSTQIKKLKEAKAEESDKFDEVGVGQTLDMHLFSRCFLNSKRKRVVMNDAFYEYQDQHGYWKPLDDRAVLKEIQRASARAYRWAGSKQNPYKKFCGSHSAAKSALQYARTELTHVDELANQHLRAFSNCTVDMRTGEARQHQSEHYLTSAIAGDYTQNQDIPETFKRFIEVSYGDDMLVIIRAAISMFLDPTAPYGHFLHIIGPSGSGKGVLLRLLQELFGVDNSSGGSSFTDFATKEERHQNLLGCLLFVIGDISGYQRGLEAFYDLVDNAPMTGRALHQPNGYSRKWNTRFALASVEYLQLENTGGGWDRRVLPLLSKRRNQKEDIPSLEPRLSEEKGQIISWALAMPKADRNAVLKKPSAYSDRIAAAIHESSVHGDSIKSFVDSCLEPIPFASRVVTPEINIGMLHDYYMAYCKACGLRGKGFSQFQGHLKSVIPDYYEDRRRMRASETDKRDSNGKPPIIPPKWIWFELIPGIFETVTDEYSGEHKFIKYIKPACRQGMLLEFATNATLTTQDVTEVTKSDRSDRSDRTADEIVKQPYINEDRSDRSDRTLSVCSGENTQKNLSSANYPDHSDHSDHSQSIRVPETEPGSIIPDHSDHFLTTDKQDKKPKTLTVTQGVTQEIALCQQRIIDALTAVELEEIQSSAGKEVYSAALNAWRNEGLYEVFYRKLQLLLEEEESVNS